MKIVMLSDVETSGGAAIAASRLATAFALSGHDVTRIVGWSQQGSFPWKTETLRVANNFTRRIARKILPVPLFEKQLSNNLCTHLDRSLIRLKPDLINIHNLHSCFPQGWRADLIRVCAAHAPTIWTLHDMWSFTGRCAYSYDCDKFISGCDDLCPTPDEYPVLAPAKIHNAWKERQKLFQTETTLIGVTPSQWLATQAKHGFWKHRDVRIIPNGLPLNRFRPVDRDFARKQFGIQDSRTPVLLMVGHSFSDRRKGTTLLLKALQQLKSSLTVITIGSNPPVFEIEGVKQISPGYVENDETKVLAYNAADIFVHPSLMENQPNVVVESIACGTPVAAFAVGGIPEVVRPGQTGWLTNNVSAEGLSRMIQTALECSTSLRETCRRIAEQDYGDELQAQRYTEGINRGDTKNTENRNYKSP